MRGRYWISTSRSSNMNCDPGVPAGKRGRRGHCPISPAGTAPLRAAGDFSDVESAVSTTLARRAIPSGQHTSGCARNPDSTPWTALFAPCRCRPPGGGGIFAERNRRSSRAPQHRGHPRLRQGGSGWFARSSELRSRRPAMKLSALVAQYVVYNKSMGMRFHTEARTLQSFCRAMGEISVAEIAPDRVQTYIAGAGPVTRFWRRKHEVLHGFYRFAITRGYAASSPSPKIVPKPPHFVPHIFSHEEMQRCSTPPPVGRVRAASCTPPLAVS